MAQFTKKPTLYKMSIGYHTQNMADMVILSLPVGKAGST
jgi:hypothetical protein